jgi:hypothetical protein
MKWINSIFFMLLVYSCNTENEKSSHLDLLENDLNSDDYKDNKNQEVAEKNEPVVILGSLQFKLENTDTRVKYLNTLINPKNLNKEIQLGNPEDSEYFTTYLGQIILNDIEFQVFKQFYTIQAAIEKHGHSVIIFVNKNSAFYYDMEMPENLPVDLKNGSFRYEYLKDTLVMKIEDFSENDLILRNVNYSPH